MADWKYHRGPDGSIVHGPECMPPTHLYPHWICFDCDYIDAHEFIPQNPQFRPNNLSCHECGLLAGDPVHRSAQPATGDGNG